MPVLPKLFVRNNKYIFIVLLEQFFFAGVSFDCGRMVELLEYARGFGELFGDQLLVCVDLAQLAVLRDEGEHVFIVEKEGVQREKSHCQQVFIAEIP